MRLAARGLVVLLGCLLGCPAPSVVPVPSGAAPAVPQLVCYDDRGVLVLATGGGQILGPLHVQPPIPLSALASANGTLVGAGQGKILVYLKRPEGQLWHQAARWEPAQWNIEPLRAASYGTSAVVWMRGNDPGTVPAALEVTAQGQVIQESLAVAERSLGGIWQSSYAPTGPYDRSFPEALRLLVAQVRVSGQLAAREEVLHSERSPWGGRLVAPDLGNQQRGDWPSAPLFFLGELPGAPPVPLEYRGEPLDFRGLIGYGSTSELYLDGLFSAAGKGVLVVSPPGSREQGGSSKRKKPLTARIIQGLRPPCAVVGVDWRG